MRKILLASIILWLSVQIISCNEGKSPVVPPDDTQNFRLGAARFNPAHAPVDVVNISATRLQNGSLELPGRDITMTASSGNVSAVTDHGDGTYDAVWTGTPVGEVVIIATDNDSDPLVQASITIVTLEYLDSQWDVPIKLASPISTDGWEASPFLYADGNHLAFSYITLDWVALSAGISQPIGEERPGQSIPQTLDVFLATRPEGDNSAWWTGWTVENAQVNLFQSLPMHVSAPMVTSDGLAAFLTVQEFNGVNYDPTVLYMTDPDFLNAPTPLGPPVDLTGLGEDNPYYDATNGWLYFDSYDLGDPLSKQNIWAAQTIGGWQFNDPVPLTDLNTPEIETQAFVDEIGGMIYFATDRDQDEYILAIWRASISGSITGTPEEFARGVIPVGRPSFSSDGQWFCFSFATIDPDGSDADIAMCRRIE